MLYKALIYYPKENRVGHLLDDVHVGVVEPLVEGDEPAAVLVHCIEVLPALGKLGLVSISPTFYSQLLCQNPFAKKLQTQMVST